MIHEQLYGGRLDGLYVTSTHPASIYVAPTGEKYERRQDGKLYAADCRWDEGWGHKKERIA